LITYG
jgi:hypothetical protein